jgi:hypothetical protein
MDSPIENLPSLRSTSNIVILCRIPKFRDIDQPSVVQIRNNLNLVHPDGRGAKDSLHFLRSVVVANVVIPCLG